MIKNEVLRVLKSIGYEVDLEDLEIPEKEGFGDVALPCFKLSKKMKKSPVEIAKEIVRKIPVTKHPLLLKVEAKNGYVNFYFYWEKIAEDVLKKIVSEQKITIGKGKRVLVEYSQPNPVHAMHIGHARGTFIGDALSNIYKFLGYNVVRANYMNDMGFQVAKLVTAYLLWYKNKRPTTKPDFWLWKIYVKFHEEMKNNPKLEEMAREILRKKEIYRDKDVEKVWNKIVRWCVRGFEETYKNLGIKFDVYFYESEFRNKGKEIVYEAIAKGIAEKTEDDAVLAKLEDYGLPNLIILRSDGTGLYSTSELGLTVEKFRRYKPDKAIWVVSSQQEVYFKQIFKIFELLGYDFYKNCYHCSFQHVNLEEGKMSSREGRAVLLDEVIKKLTEKAYDEVDKRNPKLSKKTKMNIAKKIAIGALKYSILRIRPAEEIIFDWDRMLNFEGNTAPYIQYAHTRCLGILKKARKFKYNYRPLKMNEKETKLIKILNNFEKTVIKCSEEMKVNYLANYLYELAVAFNDFYQNVNVINENDKDVRNFRLTLVRSVEIVLRNGLKLLGIETPRKM